MVNFTPEDCTYVGYGVDKTTDAPDADSSVVAAYRVPDGGVNPIEVADEYRGG